MRAAMITRYQQPLEIVNLADPKLPKDGIIMRVRATGVCRRVLSDKLEHP